MLQLQQLTQRRNREGEPSMGTKHGAFLTRLANWQGWKVCVTSVLSFACGALIAAHWIHVKEVRAESNRVFELMVYHTAPGQGPGARIYISGRFQTSGQTRSQCRRLLGAGRGLALEEHIRLPCGSAQQRGRQNPLGRTPCRSGLSTVSESGCALNRTSERGVQRGRSFYASDRFFSNEVGIRTWIMSAFVQAR